MWEVVSIFILYAHMSYAYSHYTFRLIVDPEGGAARRLRLPAEPDPVLIDSE